MCLINIHFSVKLQLGMTLSQWENKCNYSRFFPFQTPSLKKTPKILKKKVLEKQFITGKRKILV